MTFPVYFHAPGFDLPAHTFFETAGYIVGMQAFWFERRRRRRRGSLTRERHEISAEIMLWIIVAAIFGALFGSKVLAWLESPVDYWNARHDPRVFLGGKTIVGGLLGGWLGVELAKRWFGVARRTGDSYVIPLALGIAIGRIGCFLTGLPDHTYGIATSLPWGVDFGDGISRHPTQLYESLAVIFIALVVSFRPVRLRHEGGSFRLFMLGYFAFRFFVEFIKPRYTPFLGISAIQIASLVGVLLAARQLSPSQNRSSREPA